ncbi:response regulator [Pseudonocardia sp.]|uniref:response regulator n=1 Tax=Pseudonocardia sp. TaxID=60912 RepID=UPI003D13FACA
MPMLLWWGPRLTQLYNDAFTPLIGDKHPLAIGQDAAECYPEAWSELGPLADSVLAGGGAIYSPDLYLPRERHGHVEETYWTFSCSPIRAGGGAVGGMFIACTDTTSRVLAERRRRILHELGGVSTAAARSPADACRVALAVLAQHRRDVPFALAAVLDDTSAELRLAASFGAADVLRGRSPTSDSVNQRVLASGRTEMASGIRQRIGPVVEPVEPGGAVADSAVVLPLTDRSSGRTVGTIELGMSPHLAFDEEYRGFVDSVARQVSAAVTDALAYQARRERAEVIEALDRARTRFLQNVSHEFRTPLTLVLGPLTELLRDPDLSVPRRAGAEAALRAARRLERLFESLLQFARADGEPETRREPTDVAALTAACAGMFRPAIERAGLTLVLDAPAGPGLVELDQEMWVKILSNLLSNAVKFTATGTIEIRLRHGEHDVELAVADTGAGIAADQVPRIFDRFHQVPEVAASRTGEGMGIGLSLVTELVRVMGGEVGVVSTPGAGSRFTIVVPAAPSTDPGRERPAALAFVRAAVAETESWASTPEEPEASPAREPGPGGANVLLVEDNAEMRSYLVRLLRDDGCSVEAVADADAALRAIETGYDLVLSDVMLPGMDGLDLVRALRAAPATARLPILLLTARAGPESAAEGLRAGADDYIVKPFGPVELLARVRSHVELTRLREYALDQAERRAANLQAALASNRQIGTAMGILMQQRKVTEAEAFDQLRRASQTANRKLRDVADDVVLTGTLPPLGT